jgi:hypothetical protein
MTMDTQDASFDPEKYAAAQTHLKDAFEHMIAAGRSARDFSEFALEKFGDAFLPYLRRFLADVGDGNIKIKGIGKAAKTALFGTQVTPEDRAEMIRLAAYVRAEQRGFSGGTPEEDWYAAEQEVDERLAQAAGLFARGHKAMTSAGAVMEKELGNLKDSVAAWLEDTGEEKVKPKKRPAKRKAEAVST